MIAAARGRKAQVAKRYEAVRAPRFTVEIADGTEQIRIKARRNWFALLFLVFWLTLWTGGGIMAIVQLTRDFEIFLLVWLVGWAVGWLFAAIAITWQLVGVETIRVIGGDLELGYSMAGMTRRRLFRGSEISGLAPAPMGPMSRMQSAHPPFLNWSKAGSVKFNYGPRTVHAAAGLDEAEGRMIVEHLRKRLPVGAVDA
jgi:hypothetical protein